MNLLLNKNVTPGWSGRSRDIVRFELVDRAVGGDSDGLHGRHCWIAWRR
jgi:hypothetical protein